MKDREQSFGLKEQPMSALRSFVYNHEFTDEQVQSQVRKDLNDLLLAAEAIPPQMVPGIRKVLKNSIFNEDHYEKLLGVAASYSVMALSKSLENKAHIKVAAVEALKAVDLWPEGLSGQMKSLDFSGYLEAAAAALFLAHDKAMSEAEEEDRASSSVGFRLNL